MRIGAVSDGSPYLAPARRLSRAPWERCSVGGATCGDSVRCVFCSFCSDEHARRRAAKRTPHPPLPFLCDVHVSWRSGNASFLYRAGLEHTVRATNDGCWISFDQCARIGRPSSPLYADILPATAHPTRLVCISQTFRTGYKYPRSLADRCGTARLRRSCLMAGRGSCGGVFC